MRRLSASKVRSVLPALTLAGVGWAAAAAPTWDQAFGNVQGAVHVTATYRDAQGHAQPLEFWRSAAGHVVRRSGTRTELHLTPAPSGEDLYQIRNLSGRVAYDVHRMNLYRLGIFTDRWSVQHLLDRPKGNVTLSRLPGAPTMIAGNPCVWWRLQPAGGAPQDACWSTAL
ncbi:hypothetical protein, partial [Deinococcus sp.]|uniref:hypothetical protein n=1 Tax=Deinococcus sp. TaxID=47478 RepID=UPI002869DBB2